MSTLDTTLPMTPEEVESAITQVWAHNGKILIGNSQSDRTEADKLEAIGLILPCGIDRQDRRKIYLVPSPKPRYLSLQRKWQRACNTAEEALGTMQELQSDAAAWLEKLGPKGHATTRQLLNDIKDLQITNAQQTAQHAGTITFPKGFGRD